MRPLFPPLFFPWLIGFAGLEVGKNLATEVLLRERGDCGLIYRMRRNSHPGRGIRPEKPQIKRTQRMDFWLKRDRSDLLRTITV